MWSPTVLDPAPAPNSRGVAVAFARARLAYYLSGLVNTVAGKNVAFGLGEYVLVPTFHVLATPWLARRLGLEQYGIWMLANAMVGMAGAVTLGFGDATIRFVAMYRGRGDGQAVTQMVRVSLSVSIVAAVVTACLLYAVSGTFVRLAFSVPVQLTGTARDAFGLASVLVGLRIIEFVLVAALRGYERYDLSAKASVAIRLTVIAVAVALTVAGFGLQAVLLATALVSIGGIVVQGRMVCALIGASPWIPTWDRAQLRALRDFGFFSWLQGLAGLLFSYADRVVVGATLGLADVGIYSICLQLVQQIHGVFAAGFSVLFPMVSRWQGAVHRSRLDRLVRQLVSANAALAVALALPLFLFSHAVLATWMGPEFAQQGSVTLRLLAGAIAILSANVAAHYMLLGLGDVRYISFINLLAGFASLVTTVIFVPLLGLAGAAMARIVYSVVICMNVPRLIRVVWQPRGGTGYA